jgi:hypothetical protein
MEERKGGRLGHGARRWTSTRCRATTEDGSGCHQAKGNKEFAMGCCSAFMVMKPSFVGYDVAGW